MSKQKVIQMPNKWAPRPHQKPLWDYFFGPGQMEKKGKRAFALWSRRLGKDSTAINIMATSAVLQPGLYYYMGPTQKQVRKIVWDNIDAKGRRVIDQAFPPAIRMKKGGCNDQDMIIRLPHPDNPDEVGSIIQLLGSDNYNSIVGSNPRGIIFSEWAIAERPEAYDYFAPILAENGGWAIFPTTPRGMNHAFKLYQGAVRNDNWYAERVTCEDAIREDGTRYITEEAIQDERDRGMPESQIRQEFYCDFVASGDQQVFNFDAVTEAVKRDSNEIDTDAPIICGVDVARFGDDASVLTFRQGHDMVSRPIERYTKLDTNELAYRMYEAMQRHRVDAFIVDETGIGGGVCDVAAKMGLNVYGINFAKKADDSKKYYNKRAEMYGRFAEWCEEPDSCLYDEQALLDEMQCIDYEYDHNSRVKLIDKMTIKKKLGVSPDMADSCALTFAKHIPRKSVQFYQSASMPVEDQYY